MLKLHGLLPLGKKQISKPYGILTWSKYLLDYYKKIFLYYKKEIGKNNKPRNTWKYV